MHPPQCQSRDAVSAVSVPSQSRSQLYSGQAMGDDLFYFDIATFANLLQCALGRRPQQTSDPLADEAWWSEALHERSAGSIRERNYKSKGN